MSLRLFLVLVSFLPVLHAEADPVKDSLSRYRKYPLIAGIQFQNFALPFRDLQSNMKHPGFFAGTQLGINKKGNLFQNAIIGAYRNKEMGNGIYLYSQFCYNPYIYKDVFLGVKGGAGLLRVFHPAQAFKFEDGEWKKIRGGKSQLIIPFELSLGWHFRFSSCKLTPYIACQLSPALFYNKTLPLNVYTGLSAGVHINLLKP